MTSADRSKCIVFLSLFLFAVLKAAAQTEVSPPIERLIENESVTCATANGKFPVVFTFSGVSGKGAFSTGEQKLTMESYDGQKLSIRREDIVGPVKGFVAVYSGTIQGNQVSGTVAYYDRGVSNPPHLANWCGYIQNAQKPATTFNVGAVPPRLLECEGNGPCDGYWTFTGAQGSSEWVRRPRVHAKLDVRNYSPDNIVIYRNDPPPSQFAAIYRGKQDGKRISGTVTMLVNGVETGGYPWAASVPETSCASTKKTPLSAQEAKQVGLTALGFNLRSEALGCYLIAAKSGDAPAQNQVAGLLYEGGDSPVKQDLPGAFSWVQRSAAQGNYTAQLALSSLYANGKGTPADPDKAAFWAAKAASSPQGQAAAFADEVQRFEISMAASFLLGLGADPEEPTPEEAQRRSAAQSKATNERQQCMMNHNC